MNGPSHACLFLVVAFFYVCVRTEENEAPIIGVLSQEISYALQGKYGDAYSSYIAASYVKFIEGAGARVVPIWIGKDRDYYVDIVNKTNGILFPGGATWFNQSNGYGDAGVILYNLAEELNNNGDYYPLWGTCLGMEVMTYAAASAREHREDCSASKLSIPLTFKPDFRDSTMYGSAPDNIIEILQTENVTANYHQYCVTEQNMTTFGLIDNWHILSTNQDVNGLVFISSLESRKYPFYAIQFHPEKNLYEWITNYNIPHSSNATLIAQYYADVFVKETRKNKHKFPTKAEEKEALIYNFPVTYTGLNGSSYQQCYLFE